MKLLGNIQLPGIIKLPGIIIPNKQRHPPPYNNRLPDIIPSLINPIPSLISLLNFVPILNKTISLITLLITRSPHSHRCSQPIWPSNSALSPPYSHLPHSLQLSFILMSLIFVPTIILSLLNIIIHFSNIFSDQACLWRSWKNSCSRGGQDSVWPK